MRSWAGRWQSLGLLIPCLLFGWGGRSQAQDAISWKDIETKYIFGFTTGSGIGLEGEKEFTVDTIGRFGKRDGHYAATETKYEFEITPSQFIQIEFGALGSTHTIGGGTDLDDRRQVAVSGAFAELRYLAIERKRWCGRGGAARPPYPDPWGQSGKHVLDLRFTAFETNGDIGRVLNDLCLSLASCPF